MHYFAFGSNMSRRRLEDRVGDVVVWGRGTVHGYRHRFDKLGFDGTAKGNIEPSSGHEVVGVLYRLTRSQVDTLEAFEGGYARTRIVAIDGRGRRIDAVTFVAVAPGCDVSPSPVYLDHYARGLLEHGLPLAYLDQLADDLGPDEAALLRRLLRPRSSLQGPPGKC
jgi:hypothetical protein